MIPQSALGGSAGDSAILHAIRHDLVPVVAFFLGRSVGVTGRADPVGRLDDRSARRPPSPASA